MAEQPKQSFLQNLKRIPMVFGYTAKHDRLFVPLVVVAALIPVTLTVLWVVFNDDWLWRIGAIVIGLMLTLLSMMAVLNLRANAAMMNEAEGQPGAAAAILQTMRGDWRVTPAVQITPNRTSCTGVIGRAGVVLVAEGSPTGYEACSVRRRRNCPGWSARLRSTTTSSARTRDSCRSASCVAR
jgi:hypothetical protein